MWREYGSYDYNIDSFDILFLQIMKDNGEYHIISF